MFFAKKLISAFLMPFPIGIFLLLLALFFLYKKSYTKSKLFLAFGFSWFTLLSFLPISNAIISPLEQNHKALIKTPKVEYILVLGNGHHSDDNLSITSQLSSTAINRLIEGIRHYKNLKNAKLVVSGYGGVDKNSHALMQERLALALGVKKEDILRVDTPKDTQQEAIEFKKIVKQNKFILVSSASHIKRAMMIFEKLGLNPIAAPTEHKAHKTNNSLSSYFSADNFLKVQLAFHEYLGILWGKLRGFL